MNDETTLKPCPFCGGVASAEGHQGFGGPLSHNRWADGSPIAEPFFVNCISCGVSTKGHSDIGQQCRQKAIERWNTRCDCAIDQWAKTVTHVAWLTGGVAVA